LRVGVFLPHERVSADSNTTNAIRSFMRGGTLRDYSKVSHVYLATIW
jgi:hypothetical protein